MSLNYDQIIKDLEGMPFAEQLAYLESRDIVLPDIYYSDEFQGIMRANAFSVAGVSAESQLTHVLGQLSVALADGLTMEDWKETLSLDDLELPDYRLENIYRTNMQSMYARGRAEQQAQNVSRRPYLLYSAVGDSRTRVSHMAWDGIIRPITDDFWKTHTPLNGYQCRCKAIALTQSQADRRGGLSKPIPQGTQPDPGWDYSVLNEPNGGPLRAHENRMNTTKWRNELEQYSPTVDNTG